MSDPTRVPPTVVPETPPDPNETRNDAPPQNAAPPEGTGPVTVPPETRFGSVVQLHDSDAEEGESAIPTSSSSVPADLADRYQLLGEVGRGGMGAVLRGRDPTLGRDLAIKVLL